MLENIRSNNGKEKGNSDNIWIILKIENTSSFVTNTFLVKGRKWKSIWF